MTQLVTSVLVSRRPCLSHDICGAAPAVPSRRASRFSMVCGFRAEPPTAWRTHSGGLGAALRPGHTAGRTFPQQGWEEGTGGLRLPAGQTGPGPVSTGRRLLCRHGVGQGLQATSPLRLLRRGTTHSHPCLAAVFADAHS